MENLLEVRAWDTQRKDGGVAIHFWRDGGVERVGDAKFLSQCDDALLVGEIASHENVGDGDLQPLRLQESNRRDGPAQGARQFGDGIVNFRPMRIDTDLNLLDSEVREFGGFLFVVLNR